MSIKTILLSAFLFCIFFSPSITAQTTYHVKPSGNDTNDGLSWTTAFVTLQKAIDAAAANDQIWVAEGTYLPSKESDGTTDSQRDFTFYMDFDVEIYGGFPNTGIPTLNDRNWQNHPTILSGDFNADDGTNFANTAENARTIVHTKNVSSNFVVDGFFMEGGNADGSGAFTVPNSGGAWYNDGSGNGNSSNPKIQNCSFHNNQANRGGALYNNGDSGESSPTLTNCSFYNNQVNRGGALYNFGEGGESSPTLTNCSFYNNQANDGGALYNNGFVGISSPTLMNCSFHDNQANEDGGALYNYGDFSGESSPTLTNCSFHDNQANEDGGALYNDGWNGESSPILTNCSFHNNQANINGGALYNLGRSGESSPTLTNCSFQNNQANSGGALYNFGFNGESSPTLTNCSFYNNQANIYGGALYNWGFNSESSPIITNCIFWQNTGNGKTMYNDSATPQLSYTLVEESDCSFVGINGSSVSCGAGMIYAEDPLFKDAANGDLSLKQCSPAIDMGLNSANNELQDLAGNTRMVDATGSGNIDLGAYEYQSTYTICSACLTSGNIVYVNKSASGSDNGKSWADAFNDLQDAISIAKSCSNVTQIWVAEGTYLPSKESDGTTDSQRDFTFYMDFDVEIYGGFPNTGIPTLNDRNWQNHPTILSGDFDADDGANFANTAENARTIVHTKNVSSNFVVDGFFMEGGNADGSGALGNPNTSGGAWYNDGSGNGNSSNPKIQNCSFYNNKARFGGALYNNGDSGESSPTLTNCSFYNNQADFNGGALFNDGFDGESSPTLTNCSFHNNQANEDGGALYNDGLAGTSSPIITNCIFWQNTGNGKTMYNFEATPQLSYTLVEESDCSFVGSNGSSVSCGAGMIYAEDPLFTDPANGDLTLQSNSPAIEAGDNTADLDGGGIGTETIANVPFDLAGNVRIIDFDKNSTATVDMGAYETSPKIDVPTLSEWGLLNLALLLMICGTLYLVQPLATSMGELK